MKIERTKNASRNIAFGVIQKIYTLAVPFLMRTLMIYFMGVQYLGLDSLFASILQVLNLTELGVGSAMVYSMYKPIAEDDKEKICQLMRLYRTYYRIIGLVIAVVGCILIPFIPKLISEESLASLPPELNVYVLYGLNLAATVLTYWLFAYKNCLLNAHQRNDVVSKISIVTITLQYGLQIAAIMLGGYYVYFIAKLATQAITNVITAVVATKMYPDYKPVGKLPKEDVKGINHRIRDLFTAKVGGVVIAPLSTIVVSAFLGLTQLAIYQNYYYILTAVMGVISIITSACTAGIGNSIITETKEKNFNDFNKFTFIIAWITGFCTVCLLCLYQPFMVIWVGEELMLDINSVILFCAYFFVYEIQLLFCLFKDAAGMWHEDRFRPIVSAIATLVLDLILVRFWGVNGVLLATAIPLLVIAMPWLLHNIFTVLFERKRLKAYLWRLCFYTIVTIIACVLTYLICYYIPLQNKWVTFFVRLAICVVVPNVIFLLAFIKTREFKESLVLVNRMTKGKIKFLNKVSQSNLNEKNIMYRGEKMKLSNGYELPEICMGTDIMPVNLYSDSIIKRLKTKMSMSIKGVIRRGSRGKRYKGVEKTFKSAIKNGVVFFDTSRAYGGSERMLNKLIVKKNSRDKYYICTKLCNKDQLSGKSAREALRESMKQLGVDYVDLYLLHWPVEGKWIDYWKQLEELYKEGLCKAIGVSNCKVHHLEELKQYAEIMPMINEVELHPLLTENELRSYCNKEGIVIMAYTSTARNDFRLKASRRLGEICKAHNKSISQVILRWHIQNGVIPIFNTSSVDHMQSNMAIFDFELSDEEMATITGLNINARTRYDSDNCEFDRL